MKLLTATIVALTGLGLCAAPLAKADDSATETKIKAMEDAWAAAQLKKNRGVDEIAAFLASDYQGVSAKGEFRNKEEQVKGMRDGTDTYTESKNDSMNAKTYGPDVAIVSGKSTEGGKDKDGKAFTRSYAWVDTWMERDGQWQCIASCGNLLKP